MSNLCLLVSHCPLRASVKGASSSSRHERLDSEDSVSSSQPLLSPGNTLKQAYAH